MTKIRLKGGERGDTYLTNFCRQPHSVESSEKTDKNRSFQPTLWLSSAVKDSSSTADESHNVS